MSAVSADRDRFTNKLMRPTFGESKFWSDDEFISHEVTYDANDPHINITFNVLKDLHDLDLHIETKFVQKNDPTYITTTNSTINFCRFISWSHNSPIGTLLFNYLKSYGKLIGKCPIVKGEYFVHKFWYPEDLTFANSPEIDFEVHIIGYHLDASMKREKILEDHIKGETVVKDVSNTRPGILAMLPKTR
ncbi:uncharacterized protein [Eurosta solidaginis]|uniref:uncharacterized protein isoform X2 n=1 Tax=Eurosta solidaginis TaxID=178769 RepID=UPI003530FAF1